MPNYSFSFINHLDERFLTQLAPCADDEAAIAHGKTLEDAGYRVEIHIDGRHLSLSAIPQWRPYDWLIKALK